MSVHLVFKVRRLNLLKENRKWYKSQPTNKANPLKLQTVDKQIKELIAMKLLPDPPPLTRSHTVRLTARVRVCVVEGRLEGGDPFEC